MKKFTLALVALISAGFTSNLPVNALPLHNNLISQNPEDSVTLQKSKLGRAQNLARQAAEEANGGLNNYRAESSMYGDPQEAPFVDNGNGSWTFTFKGGQPNNDPTIETAVTVSNDFSSIIVDYNGPLRQ